ncbi:hypothetical protein HYH38_15215 [Clostridium botulinum]|uniref:hypothetical protein n=1 Tax=Clostridium TaxID=1485 RepID=UPI000174E4BE|nr:MULTISPECIES: hypothetical protein [Clostridium]ACD51258.1 hypothetical protein CLH_0122 [Clostridium botulinum E3 str. Alaska E43]MBY6790644.1 hypothetical protein [Clostridium botulinum]MBY6818323.1 hypothetical protein [Clostridium botulinum]MBY6828600.1 hypothetical protein [Clostridium botulinum]MBY6839110.1 hypothetical protein [Clostridium botulinum]
MSNKEKHCNCKDPEVTFKEEKIKVDPSNPCDPTHPDYPWAPCGIDKKNKTGEKQ